MKYAARAALCLCVFAVVMAEPLNAAFRELPGFAVWLAWAVLWVSGPMAVQWIMPEGRGIWLLLLFGPIITMLGMFVGFLALVKAAFPPAVIRHPGKA